MLRTVLLLDGSAAINSSVDYLPSRLLALRPHVMRLVEAILESAFAAQIAVVVMRDGVAHRISGVSSNAGELAERLEKAYFMFGGVGSMSLDNGLRLALSELVPIQKPTSASSAARYYKKRVVLLLASVTSIDHSDVYGVFSILKRQRVAVDVLSICGATHLTTQLAVQTGGRFVCPLNYDQMRAGIESFADLPPSLAAQDGDAPVMLPVAFPVVVLAPAADSADQRELIGCSRCALPLSSVPATCPQCKILVCSLPYVHVKANMLAPAAQQMPEDDAALSAPVCCAECCVVLSRGGGLFKCGGCARWRCQECESYIRTVLHACPSCVASTGREE
jgi:transcription initiation factor TFIIH subunit 2